MEGEKLFVQKHLFSVNRIQALLVRLRSNYGINFVIVLLSKSPSAFVSPVVPVEPRHHLQYTLEVLKDHSAAMRINN